MANKKPISKEMSTKKRSRESVEKEDAGQDSESYVQSRLQAHFLSMFDFDDEDGVLLGDNNMEVNGEDEEDMDNEDDIELGSSDDDDNDEEEELDGDDEDNNEEFDDDEDLLASSKTTSSKPKITKPSQAPVIVFHDKSEPLGTTKGSKYDYKSFMSDSITKLTSSGKPKPKSKGAAANEEAAQDAQDDRHDRELMELLQTSKLIEQITASELSGKDRRKYLESKMVELGGKPGKKPTAPTPIRIGIAAAQKKREVKRIEEAKASGMYDKKLTRHLFLDEKTKQKATKDKQRRKPLWEKGLKGSVGKFKSGTLYVSQKEILAVEGMAKRGARGPAGVRKLKKIKF